MPHDTDDVPREGWAFWTFIAVAGGVVVGHANATGQTSITVLGMFATMGALNQVITEIRHDRKVIDRNARRAEQERIRTAMRDAAKARLEELNRDQP